MKAVALCNVYLISQVIETFSEGKGIEESEESVGLSLVLLSLSLTVQLLQISIYHNRVQTLEVCTFRDQHQIAPKHSGKSGRAHLTFTPVTRICVTSLFLNINTLSHPILNTQTSAANER